MTQNLRLRLRSEAPFANSRYGVDKTPAEADGQDFLSQLRERGWLT